MASSNLAEHGHDVILVASLNKFSCRQVVSDQAVDLADAVFQAMLPVIDTFGGSVFDLDGHQLLARFEIRDDLAGACAQAVQASMGMRQTLERMLNECGAEAEMGIGIHHEAEHRASAAGVSMASALAEQMDSILISENVLQAVHAALDTNIRVTKIWISAVGDGVIAHQLSMPTDTQPALANSSEGQILIAEDHADLREIFATVLRRAGYTVNIAANGHEAMQFLNRGLPDLLLLDINMPGPSGLEILRYIRQSQKPVKVIVITANSQAGRTAEADMADLFLLKPVRMTEVVQLANRFVRAGA